MVLAEEAFVSPIKVWEMAIKHAIGKMPLPTTDVAGAIAAQGFVWIPVQPNHAQAMFALPPVHRDPFDRLLIAQATAESMRVIAYDSMFARYLPDTLIVN